MDEKTEELREIFIDATGADAVTERQEESPGSITDADADADESTERLRELVGTMRERYEFTTDLDDDDLLVLLRRFHDGADDGAIAGELGVDPAAVFDARMDLHLVRDRERERLPVERLRPLVADGADDDAVAAELGAEGAAVDRARRIAEAEAEATRANDRFRDGFEERLTDSELSARLARDAREDGLREATEDMETDVSF